MKEFVSCIKNLPRHFVTAVQNIWRNGVMSFSSIFAVTITLLLIGVIGVLALNVQDISANIEEGVSIYVKLERNIDSEAELAVGDQINAINGVTKSTYYTKDQELDKLIEKQGEDGAELFESYRDENPLGAAYEVEVKDASQIEAISKKIEEIPNVNSATYGGESTENMVQTLQTIQTGGTVFIVGLSVVALFMIANTIKITITARQTEISIMRMVGASNWYIRLPYMLEGVFIGLLGSIVPILVVYFGYNWIYSGATDFLPAMVSMREPFPFIWQCSGIMIALGCGVGLIGSFVSVRKFLKF